jgi:hypothetical protein
MALVAASVGLAGCSEDASESESVDAGAPTTAEGPKTDAGLTAQELVIEPPVAAPAAAANAAPLGEVEEIEWDSLIPDDWRPDLLMGDEEIADLSDDDPRAKELMEKLEALWKEAPVVEALDGRAVRLPGFVVPLETDGKAVSSFLLVPYYGACIHVPPPPANQTVYVVTETGNPFRGELFDTVWVTGTLRVEPTSSELAEAGYSIKGARVAPYDEAVSAE